MDTKIYVIDNIDFQNRSITKIHYLNDELRHIISTFSLKICFISQKKLYDPQIS